MKRVRSKPGSSTSSRQRIVVVPISSPPNIHASAHSNEIMQADTVKLDEAITTPQDVNNFHISEEPEVNRFSKSSR